MIKKIFPTNPPVNYFRRDDGTEEYNAHMKRCKIRVDMRDGDVVNVHIWCHPTDGNTKHIDLNNTAPLEDIWWVARALVRVMGTHEWRQFRKKEGRYTVRPATLHEIQDRFLPRNQESRIENWDPAEVGKDRTVCIGEG